MKLFQNCRCSIAPPRAVSCAGQVAATVLALGLLTAAAEGEGDGFVSFPVKVSDPRPLAAAALQLQQRYGVAISYEDPPFSHPQDLVEVLVESPVPGAEETAILIPAGGGLEMKLGAEAGASVQLDPAAVLASLVMIYEKGDQPGRFQVVQDGEMFHLLPTAMRQGTGALGPVTPLLDTVISLDGSPRRADVVLHKIRNKLHSASGVNIEVGMTPVQLLYDSTVSVGGTNLPARDLLVQFSEALPMPVTWRLLWDATLETYYLNLVPVARASSELLYYQPPVEQAPAVGGEG